MTTAEPILHDAFDTNIVRPRFAPPPGAAVRAGH